MATHAVNLLEPLTRVDVLSIAPPNRYLLRVTMLIQGGELDEGNIDFAAAPVVEADDHLMDGEQKVVIRLLQGLGDGIEFPLVRAAVVGLRLARHAADKVAMHAHSEAEHIHRLLDVGVPVAALLVVVKSAIEREQYQACLNIADCEQIIQTVAKRYAISPLLNFVHAMSAAPQHNANKFACCIRFA